MTLSSTRHPSSSSVPLPLYSFLPRVASQVAAACTAGGPTRFRCSACAPRARASLELRLSFRLWSATCPAVAVAAAPAGAGGGCTEEANGAEREEESPERPAAGSRGVSPPLLPPAAPLRSTAAVPSKLVRVRVPSKAAAGHRQRRRRCGGVFVRWNRSRTGPLDCPWRVPRTDPWIGPRRRRRGKRCSVAGLTSHPSACERRRRQRRRRRRRGCRRRHYR